MLRICGFSPGWWKEGPWCLLCEGGTADCSVLVPVYSDKGTQHNTIVNTIRCSHPTLSLSYSVIHGSHTTRGLFFNRLYNIGHCFSQDSVPRSLTVQFKLFAGSLYLRSFAKYTELRDYLDLLTTEARKVNKSMLTGLSIRLPGSSTLLASTFNGDQA
jgi:hypothetical protein